MFLALRYVGYFPFIAFKVETVTEVTEPSTTTGPVPG